MRFLLPAAVLASASCTPSYINDEPSWFHVCMDRTKRTAFRRY